jgi:ribonucleoside-triphosphate reductase
MSVELLQDYTAASKYAVHLPHKKRRETWDESVTRVEEMMVSVYPSLAGEIREAYGDVRARNVLGSMRNMQFGGSPVLRKHARSYNCSYLHFDRLRALQEGYWLGLCGTGVGFSVQSCHTKHVPDFSRARRAGGRLPKKTYVVPDTIEGWANAGGILLSSYHETPIREWAEYHDCDVEFDYSLIREKNSPLSFGIGRAPGPEPLIRAITMARRVLDGVLSLGYDRLRNVDLYDIFMYFADSIVSGGVRRMATICLFDLRDELMAGAKAGAWFADNPQRGRSNNSALLVRGQTEFADFKRLFDSTRQFGEPGFIWSPHEDVGVNPCAEVNLYPRLYLRHDEPVPATYDGPVIPAEGGRLLSGVQFCNLSTINMKTCPDADEYERRAGVASFIGTLQAGFTDFPYLGEVSERITRREALLGVGMNGMMNRPDVSLNPDYQRRAAAKTLEVNARVAPRIGINLAARVTLAKPEGNSSSLLGCEPGIHGAHSELVIRNVQANRLEAPYQYFRDINGVACEPSLWSASGTDDVISFTMESPAGSVYKKRLSALEFLGYVRLTQENWVRGGMRPELCAVPGMCHNVSNTVHVRDHEWDAVAEDIFKHQEMYTGVSLISFSGDKDYAQAPYQAVFTPEQQAEYYGPETVKLAESLLDYWYAAVDDRHLWLSCDVALGLREAESFMEQGWADLVGAAADPKRLTYAIKDVYNWRRWEKLKASLRSVDYSQMVEEDSTINMSGEVACAGGACLL